MAKLIVYYSRADENYFGDSMRYVEEGNTAKVARMLSEIIGADTFEIKQKTPYAKDYETCIKEAMADLQNNARPELVEWPENFEDYDEIYLGFPNYWDTMPMAVYTFLEKYTWLRKRVYPFATHQGSGLGHSLKDLRKPCRGAMIMKGLAVKGENVDKFPENVKLEVERWALYGE